MDSSIVLAGLSIIILLAYFFEFIGQKLKLPSVVLLVFSGIGVRFLTDQQSISVPYIDQVLPVFGTVGLILIVLEGALELEVSRKKGKMIRRSFTLALLGVVLTAVCLTAIFHKVIGMELFTAWVNALPFSVISSAVAIPAARSLNVRNRELVTYESAFSDIIGIILFNAAIGVAGISLATASSFFGNILLMIGVSIFLSVGMTLYIDKIAHRIKFMPILALLILVYAGAKMLHLSPLILILIFGLFINNLEFLADWKWFKDLNYKKLNQELEQFRQIVVELVFFTRTFFFLIFGFSVQLVHLLELNLFVWAGILFAAIAGTRLLTLLLVDRKTINPLLFFSPRGLITILLFISIPPPLRSSWLSNEITISIVLMSLLFLTFGNIIHARDPAPGQENSASE